MSSASSLPKHLHARFCEFQVQAKSIEERVEATLLPVNSGVAEDLLERYSCDCAAELRRRRDELRRGRWDIDRTIHEEHDTLCFCLAVWELVHEVAVSSAPCAARILHWYNRHYLEEEIAEWHQTAQQWAEDPEALASDSPFWEPLYRLALSDCHGEVLNLLERSAAKADTNIARACAWLRTIPSLEQMAFEARASEAEFRQACHDIQGGALAVLRDVPGDHPIASLLQIYAGCTQAAFEAGEDISRRWARTWVEDFAYSHAWVYPDLARTELVELLREVGRRRTDEKIDDVDRVLFTVLSLDIPGLLQILGTLPERFPTLVVAHLVDILYFAGRVPLACEREGPEAMPPRDWHLLAYAEELGSQGRPMQRLAIDYLRAGGAPAIGKKLELFAEQYCESATAEDEVEEALTLLVDLGLHTHLGAKVCRSRAQQLRRSGDFGGCLRWACRAEGYSARPRGYYVSELLEEVADDDLVSLLAVFTPANPEAEPLDVYPPASLLELLGPPTAPGSSGTAAASLAASLAAPSGRLYFLVQYARCRALRLAGHRPSAWAPALVRLLALGVAPPRLARMVIEEELVPALVEDVEEPPLGSDDALLLMRYVQSISSDPLGRVRLSMDGMELQRVMGTCLSRAILRAPRQVAGASPSFPRITSSLVA
eukprot:gnl/TRDRNA2_/TRDRNA2_38963_c0_seq1.p1 gnl/TRDRNA2_/TRDRNA2_38963_c0~~gnl/TRDRNA2_/TRDRNA2_38963_c0_seq1.p1  ORF type:complete len:688 (+),score=130.58 gnl/TRDRNA2_/TRDRNA2_38963_c0_seq1:91-2064(+)